MSPLTQSFPTSALASAVQTTTKNFQETARKPPGVNLSECALMEMVQYSCNPPEKGPPQGPTGGPVIECESVVRLFRRCAAGLTVETTTWERKGKGKKEEGKQ
ncbi:hypothetical protein GX51_05837 [Blastomyces parvus]|uniref:Mitochondrial export protein Som1 n=1 Tax=Blastomyces parvus TaxID=2060905 RepID=A0A2B7WUR7_9EURO|nr:hypothetical protein GX51_05837 [Blastomyces parvus]